MSVLGATVRRVRQHNRNRIVRAILRWYAHHGRRLPWRDVDDHYRILVAEIMLHQTQVNRVLQKYPLFLRRFPTLKALARSPQSAVVIAWQGLGYNNRAVRLHRLSRLLVDDLAGKIPACPDELARLPGIGKYTAHALAVSVHRKDFPVVDVNIRRVLSRVFWRMPTTADVRPEGEVWGLAEALVPRGRGYDWMQAVMDLGSAVCTARTPACSLCPIRAFCASSMAMARTVPVRVTREPSLDGVPNRIYRGRIVERLRGSGGQSGIPAGRLGRAIYPHFAKRHEPWLRRLLDGLVRDGLIRMRRDGTFVRTLVRLA